MHSIFREDGLLFRAYPKIHFIGMQCKALGAQQPERTLRYVRIASTQQRSNAPEK